MRQLIKVPTLLFCLFKFLSRYLPSSLLSSSSLLQLRRCCFSNVAVSSTRPGLHGVNVATVSRKCLTTSQVACTAVIATIEKNLLKSHRTVTATAAGSACVVVVRGGGGVNLSVTRRLVTVTYTVIATYSESIYNHLRETNKQTKNAILSMSNHKQTNPTGFIFQARQVHRCGHNSRRCYCRITVDDLSILL